MDEASAARIELTRIERGAVSRAEDFVAREEPLEIRVEGRSTAVTMRTPGGDDELAVGFLVSEALIQPSDVDRVSFGDPLHASQPENHIVVHLRTPFDAMRIPARTTVATASCGICGKASLDDVAQRIGRVAPVSHLSAASMLGLVDRLRGAQQLFEGTGGLHAAAAVDVRSDGTVEIATVREDVGRHNAVDKLIGEAALRGGLPFEGRLLLLSGRCSFELVQKGAVAGFGAIACVVLANRILLPDLPPVIAIAAALLGAMLLGTIVTGLVDLLAHQAWMVAAVVGMVLMFTLALSSWRRLRQRIPYETWYFIHLTAYLAVLLGFGHQLTMGSDFVGDRVGTWWWVALYLVVLAIVLVDRQQAGEELFHEQGAEQRHPAEGQEEGEPVGPLEVDGEDHHQEGRHHRELALREVDDVAGVVDQREAERDQRINRTDRNPRQHELHGFR